MNYQAARDQVALEKGSTSRTQSISRGGSSREGNRGGGEHLPGVYGWSVAGNAIPRPPSKAGDLTNFGKINKSQPMTFGPSSVFAGKKQGATKRESLKPLSRTDSTISMMGVNCEDPAAAAAKSRPPNCKSSVDSGYSDVPGRRELQLLPRAWSVEQIKVNGTQP